MERESKFAEITLQASGMSVLDGPAADNRKMYYSVGVSGGRPGQLSRLNGKAITGNLGRSIVGFGQFWNPVGYIVTVRQEGFGFFGTGADGTVAGGPTGLNGNGPQAAATPGVLGGGYFSNNGIVDLTETYPNDTNIDYGVPGPRPDPDPPPPDPGPTTDFTLSDRQFLYELSTSGNFGLGTADDTLTNTANGQVLRSTDLTAGVETTFFGWSVKKGPYVWEGVYYNPHPGATAIAASLRQAYTVPGPKP